AASPRGVKRAWAAFCCRQLGAKLPKVTAALLLRESLSVLGTGTRPAQTLIIGKKEQLVFLYGTADGAAKHVVAHCRRGLHRPGGPGSSLGVGIKIIVPQELKGIAVQGVGAGFDADANDATSVIAKIGAGVLGDNVELLNCIDVRRVSNLVVLGFLIHDAVQKETNCLFAIAIDVRTPGIGHQLRS